MIKEHVSLVIKKKKKKRDLVTKAEDGGFGDRGDHAVVDVSHHIDLLCFSSRNIGVSLGQHCKITIIVRSSSDDEKKKRKEKEPPWLNWRFSERVWTVMSWSMRKITCLTSFPDPLLTLITHES